jgi:cellulose biosynthesis protein BcsQ
MPIISCVSEKGGVMKTAAATTLAVKFNYEYPDQVILIDADGGKRGSKYWSSLRNKDMDLPKIPLIHEETDEIIPLVANLKNKYKWIIIDSSNKDSVSLRSSIYIGDAVIALSKPNPDDSKGIEIVDNLISQSIKEITNQKKINPKLPFNEEKKCLLIPSMVSRPNSTLLRDFREGNIKKHTNLVLPDLFISNRDCFPMAYGYGMGVCSQEYNEKGAMDQMDSLYNHIKKALNNEK